MGLLMGEGDSLSLHGARGAVCPLQVGRTPSRQASRNVTFFVITSEELYLIRT